MLAIDGEQALRQPLMSVPTVDVEKLLAKTEAFINTMHAVRDGLSLRPEKEHIATCINYADLKEMRERFVEELTNTVTSFVYSPLKQDELIELFKADGRDSGGAGRHLYRRARKKFRPSSLQGQFSELLLCSLLQHYFKAVPVVRKMPLTTNPALERNGADALHVGRGKSGYVLYIGEAKTYKRVGGSLRDALVDAIDDVVNKHYANHMQEFDLYVYEDFIPSEIEQLVRDFLDGKQPDVEVHLVCIVAYDDSSSVVGMSRKEKLDCIISALRKEADAAKSHPVFDRVPVDLLPRLNYILFPIQKMDTLLMQFEKELRG